MPKARRPKLPVGLILALALMPILSASQSGEQPIVPGQVIPDLNFEPIVDIVDTQLEPPLVEDSIDDPRELDYLTPEPDESGDDAPPTPGSGGESGGSKQ